MKRTLLIFLAVLCMLVPGCAKKQPAQMPAEPASSGAATGQPAETVPEENEEISAASAVQTLAPSSNKEVATEETAPKIFWAMDVAYHLQDCQVISGVDAKEIPWSMVQEIGLRQCPECNPPRYENYIE